jgi:hypothetical protein
MINGNCSTCGHQDAGNGDGTYSRYDSVCIAAAAASPATIYVSANGFYI